MTSRNLREKPPVEVEPEEEEEGASNVERRATSVENVHQVVVAEAASLASNAMSKVICHENVPRVAAAVHASSVAKKGTCLGSVPPVVAAVEVAAAAVVVAAVAASSVEKMVTFQENAHQEVVAADLEDVGAAEVVEVTEVEVVAVDAVVTEVVVHPRGMGSKNLLEPRRALMIRYLLSTYSRIML